MSSPVISQHIYEEKCDGSVNIRSVDWKTFVEAEDVRLYNSYNPNLAVDGNLITGQRTQRASFESQFWWVDLGTVRQVEYVQLYHLSQYYYRKRFKNVQFFLSNTTYLSNYFEGQKCDEVVESPLWLNSGKPLLSLYNSTLCNGLGRYFTVSMIGYHSEA